MAKYANYILSALVLLLVLQVVIFAPRSVNGPHSELRAPEASTTPDVAQAMRGVHLVESREGGREWELWADEAVAFRDKDLWELRQVKVILFADNGVEFTVTGNKGEIDSVKKNLKVMGDVVTRSSNGYVFKTESVAYDSETRKIMSPSLVKMEGPRDQEGGRLSLTGEGLIADMTSSLINIERSVRAERGLSQGRHVVIRSEGAEFSGREKRARFLGNVVMDMEQMRITGPEAEFEYGSDTNIVKSIGVKGGVRVSDAEKWATAQNLKVHLDDDKYVFKGSPRVVQDTDELRGEEIVFLDGGRRVLVQRARAKVDEKTLEKVN